MGTLISRLNDKQAEIYQQSIANLVQLCHEQNDTELAQLIVVAAQSNDLKRILQAHFPPQAQHLNTKHSPKSDEKVNSFIAAFNRQEKHTRQILQERIKDWTEKPRSFWGYVEVGHSLSATAVIQNLFKQLRDIDDGQLLASIRRRIARAALRELRVSLEKRLEFHKLKLRPRQTLESVANTVLLGNTNRFERGIADRERLLSGLRDGERYCKFPVGMLMVCGTVSGQAIERATNKTFESILLFCNSWWFCLPDRSDYSTLESHLKESFTGEFNPILLDEVIELGLGYPIAQLPLRITNHNPSRRRKLPKGSTDLTIHQHQFIPSNTHQVPHEVLPFRSPRIDSNSNFTNMAGDSGMQLLLVAANAHEQTTCEMDNAYTDLMDCANSEATNQTPYDNASGVCDGTQQGGNGTHETSRGPFKHNNPWENPTISWDDPFISWEEPVPLGDPFIPWEEPIALDNPFIP